MPPTVVFWDIDGTLLTTGRAGIFAWEDATLEVLGRRLDFGALNTAGLTDVEIAWQICGRVDPAASGPAVVDRLVGEYEARLPGVLHRRQGTVLPGVRVILEQIHGRADMISALLTGNTRRGAQAKLRYYGLEGFFAFGAFSGVLRERAAIARAALEVAASHVPGFDCERAFVVGDTPHDVACAQAVSVRAIAVASGQYAMAELAACGPWRVLPSLPDVPEFFSLLEAARVEPRRCPEAGPDAPDATPPRS